MTESTQFGAGRSAVEINRASKWDTHKMSLPETDKQKPCFPKDLMHEANDLHPYKERRSENRAF